jgi:hypothetical protein
MKRTRSEQAPPNGWTAQPISEAHAGKSPIVEILDILALPKKETRQLLNRGESEEEVREKIMSAQRVSLEKIDSLF